MGPVRSGIPTERGVCIRLLQCPIRDSPLHDVLVHVMQEVRRAAAIRCRKNDIQPHVEGLPCVAHHDRIVVVQCVEFLHALEAIIDEEGL